jgi:hypothetical protein
LLALAAGCVSPVGGAGTRRKEGNLVVWRAGTVLHTSQGEDRMNTNLIDMSIIEREHYVRWWIEESGLSPFQLRQVATELWSDRLEMPLGDQPSFEVRSARPLKLSRDLAA